ncbi:MAG: caspase family protein [Myxococcota bacterium]
MMVAGMAAAWWGFWLSGAALAGVTSGDDVDLDAVYEPRRVAVLIGIQDYRDPDLRGLRYAAKDAADMRQALLDPDIGGFDDVYVLHRQDETTAAAIAHALQKATADLQRDDTFLLYVSGHGTLTVDPLGSELYLLPSDGDLDRPAATGVQVAWLEAMLSELDARRRVLIMDTCHNGRVGSRSALSEDTARQIARLRGEPPAPNVLTVSDSEARLFAAEYHQPAMEDPELENGVYTHYLLDALTDARGRADLDRDGLVDVIEAHNYAMTETARHTGGAQVPRIETRITGSEKIYLSGDPERRMDAEQAILSAYNQLLTRAELFIDGIPRGVAAGAHPVEPGRHVVEIRSESGHRIGRQRVRLNAGTVTALDALIVQYPSRWVYTFGGAYRQGPGQYQHPTTFEADVSRLRPFGLGQSRWHRPAAHLRTNATYGTLPAEGIDGAFGGEVALGGGYEVLMGPLSVGPVVEGVALWRVFDDTSISGDPYINAQNAWTWSTGGRARLMGGKTDGAIEWGVRYDIRWTPYAYGDEQTFLVHHGLAVGFSPSPR